MARVLTGHLRSRCPRVTAAETTLHTTRELAASPGRALYSPETCAENVVHLLRIGVVAAARAAVRPHAVMMFAVLTGVADELKAKGAAERHAELEGHRPQAGAFTVPVAMPGTAGWPSSR